MAVMEVSRTRRTVTKRGCMTRRLAARTSAYTPKRDDHRDATLGSRPPPPFHHLMSDEPESPVQHVSFILLAEFDIDQGSVLARQYPFPTGTDEQ